MDYDNASNRQADRKSGVSAATMKMQPTEAQHVGATMANDASLAFRLPDHQFTGQMQGSHTVDDEFNGME